MSENANANANVTREWVLSLMEERNKMEAELQSFLDVLQSQGIQDMKEQLVDQQGYPRNDIDVHQVRIARNKIICLRNDLKDVMAKIESGLHNLHQQSRDGLGPEVNMPEVLAQATGKVYLGPSATFARVDLVTEGSPAERAGFIVGDLVSNFGSINTDNFNGDLRALAELALHNKGQRMTVKVVRGGRDKTLTLIPADWGGRGLIGCKIVPTEENVDR